MSESKVILTYAALAKQVKDAIKGAGTNDTALINILTSFDYYDLRKIGEAYQLLYGSSIIKDVGDDTSFNYKKIAQSLLMKRSDFDATTLKNSIKSIGSNDDAIIEIICTRKPDELKQIISAYNILFSKDLIKDIKDHFSGNYCKLLVTVLTSDRTVLPDVTQMEKDFNEIYSAGEGKLGTDDAAFIRIIGSNPRVYVEQLGILYLKKYGHTLGKAIKSETSFAFQHALLALATPLPEYLAEMLYKSVKGAGTDDDALIRIIVSQKDRYLRSIATAFRMKYKATLVKWVEDDTSGDFKKVVIGVLKLFANEV